ncbi:hypothetical protein Xvtw_16485 [Xanthomonas campestris pv. vitiswoodrowii]|nr:hypothetical protein Xvtw_16485 [Xanthomonas campestris pv. vitiswoodrowii]
MPKPKLLAECPGLANGWDAWGVMEILVADNGMEFHAGALDNAIGRFGMILQFCPRRKPWFKGKIERFFGTLNKGLIETLPGKTFSTVVGKCDYDPAKHAVLGLAALRRVVLTWIIDIYHQKRHRGLGISPATAWREQIVAVDRPLPPSSLSVQAAFSRSETRKLTHKGIELNGLLYNSADLGAVRQIYGSEIRVEVRVLDEDIGSIVVVVPDSTEIIRVSALDQAYAAGLTRWQHEVCKRYQRRISEDDGVYIALLEARERIKQELERERGRGKRLSKGIGRFIEGGATSNTKCGAPRPEPTMPVPASDVPEALFRDEIQADEDEALPDMMSYRVLPHAGSEHVHD